MEQKGKGKRIPWWAEHAQHHLAMASSTTYTPIGHTLPALLVVLAISLSTLNEAVGGQEACPGVLVLLGVKDCMQAPGAGEQRQDMLVSPSVSPCWVCTMALGLLYTNIGHISTLIADDQCWICNDPAIAVNVPEDTSSVNTPSLILHTLSHEVNAVEFRVHIIKAS